MVAKFGETVLSVQFSSIAEPDSAWALKLAGAFGALAGVPGPVIPKTCKLFCVPTKTCPLATVGTANLTAAMLPWSDDFAAHLAMYPFVALTALAIYALARECRAPWPAAVLIGWAMLRMPTAR